MSHDYEPDWDSLKEVTHPCGHRSLRDRGEDDPGPGDLCWNCQPCRACGERYADCVCPALDPFEEK